MATVGVPRAELLRLVGLKPDSKISDSDLAAIASDRAQNLARARQASAKSAAENTRLVEAAVADGRIPVSRKGFWMDALNENPANRQLLASLAVGLPAATPSAAPDPAVASLHRHMMRRLGVKAEVKASAPRPGGQVRDDLGIPKPALPEPVLTRKAVPLDQWTEKQRQDYFLRRLGGPFARGTEPTPALSDSYFIPSPNSPSIPTEDGRWVDNPNYQARSRGGRK